jgi:MoxR-like ATPase
MNRPEPDSPALSALDARRTIEEVAEQVVGRERELELIVAAVSTGCDVLLEGPPGTSKTTLLRAITKAWGIPLVLVEGSGELTPGRLIGHHDPSRVLQEGFNEDTFEPGPLVRAMELGGFLHFEEFNRAPEDTLNTLLTAIADREINVPRYGTIQAAPTFRVIGSMNPYDNVGTTRLSVSINDRLCRIILDYQDEVSEREVVVLRTGTRAEDELGQRIAADATALTRMTRRHDQVRQGSSVRGAIDLARLASHLCAVREIESAEEDRYREAIREAMGVALTGRLLIDEATDATPQRVLREIWESYFILDPAAAQPG